MTLHKSQNGQLSVMKVIRPANDAGEVVLGSGLGGMLDGGVADAEE